MENIQKIHKSKGDRQCKIEQKENFCLCCSYLFSVRTGQADRGINAPLATINKGCHLKNIYYVLYKAKDVNHVRNIRENTSRNLHQAISVYNLVHKRSYCKVQAVFYTTLRSWPNFAHVLQKCSLRVPFYEYVLRCVIMDVRETDIYYCLFYTHYDAKQNASMGMHPRSSSVLYFGCTTHSWFPLESNATQGQ